MEPECNFWGLRIPAGEEVEVAPEWKEDFITSVHLTQAALGDKAKNGAHTIFVEKEGEKFALGTLDREQCTHFSLDIHIATDSITISHTGKSDVYITGYEAISVNAEEDSPFPWQQPGGLSDGEEESSDEEGEEAPQGVPIPGKGGRHVMIDDEAEESSDEEGASDEEGESDEEEGDSDEDEDDGLLESDEEDEEESSEEEEEGSEEEEPQQPPPKAAGKRPAKQPPAATPQPAKRGKAEAPKAAPATAPPKVAAGLPADDKQYLAALKAHLKSKGTTKLAALGSAVKRPAKAPKLKHFLEQHKATFKYDPSADTVSLA